MNKKIFIIGASGLIGSALYRNLSAKKYGVLGGDKELLEKDFIFIDITSKKSIEDSFSKIKPDIVVLTAALNHVDYCEEFPQKSEEVNIQGLKNIIEQINFEKEKIVYFSSDYIFDGSAGPYSEEDKPNPLNVYGIHKAMAEEIIKKNFKNYLIIRTTGVYGPEKREKNFVLSLVKRLKKGEKIKVPFDQIGNPTYSENLAEAIEELLRKEKSGIYNIVGSELTDRYSFAKEVCNIFGFSKNMLIPVSSKELGQKAKRPLKGGLKIDKVKKDILTPLLSYKEGLLLLKKHYE